MSSTTQATTGPASYIERAMRITFILGQGDFGEKSQNKVVVEGLRVHASIQLFGYPTSNQAQCRVYGLTPDIMNKVSLLGVARNDVRNNHIIIEAGDKQNGMNVVFYGLIYTCWQNFNSQPETYLDITSHGGVILDQAKPAPPTSVNGTADVATIMAGLARRMNRQFENNGVNVKVSNPYLHGTAWDQAQQLARQADIQVYPDDSKTPATLAIWPKNGSRGGTIPVISPASGLINYPTFADTGMRFRCVFNPSLRFGGNIEMKSTLTPANKTWFVNALSYDLSANLPGGPWFCDVGCMLLATNQKPAS